VLGSNCDGGSLEQKDNDVLMQGDGGSIEQKDNNVFIEDDMTTKKSQDSQPASASEIATTDSVGAPKFLSAPIMRYLREISDAEAWQALITEYFAFEKGGYPVGVYKLRLFLFLVINGVCTRNLAPINVLNKSEYGSSVISTKNMIPLPSSSMTMNPSSAVGGLPCSLLGVFSRIDSIAEKCLPMKPGLIYRRVAHRGSTLP
jgi:hypothetical protein